MSAAPASAPAPRRRLAPAERQREIIEEAIRFFAEVGFDGQTRELAARLGITQPLLYRYFPSKQALVDRVYEALYLERWNPAWDGILADASRPLRDRLIDLYRIYVGELASETWIRIYLYAALEGGALNRRHAEFLDQHVVQPICRALIAAAGRSGPPSQEEVEAVRQWHAGMVFYAVRKHVYRVPVHEDLEQMVTANVDAFLDGNAAKH